MSGKGSAPRPFSVDQQTYAANWDAVFGKKKASTAEQFDRAIMADEYYDLDEIKDEQDRQAGC